MKLRFPSLLAVAVLLLPGVCSVHAGEAAQKLDLTGHWQIAIDKSSAIRPWDQETLEITQEGDVVQIDRRLQWGRTRKVGDVTRVKTDGKTVTASPVPYWLDTWYNNVYIGGDHQKHVTGEWLDGGRILKLETNLTLEAQQGDVPVHLYNEYRLSPDGKTLTLFELRSTRDQPLTFVFDRVYKFAEPEGMVTTASGLKYLVTHHGDGAQAQPGQVVIAHYTGTLVDGTVFDSSRERDTPFAFTLGKEQVIKGWDEGFALLHVGDQATLIIPPELAYGDKNRGPIPANSTLKFDVEFVGTKAHALADLIQETIDDAGVEAAMAKLAELKQSGFGDYYLSESQLNSLGYGYLQKDKLPEALAVFRENVALFPESGNTHDSYAEALRKNGQKDQSLAEYRKALELDPSNENAVKMIAELTSEK